MISAVCGLAPGAAARLGLSYDALAARHPGRVLEVRIPPVAAVQCLPGPVHTRGTPPNVVETDTRTWLALATGRVDFFCAACAPLLPAVFDAGLRATPRPYHDRDRCR